MLYSTTLCDKVKRAVFNFSEKISDGLSRPEHKFIADMVFGIAASGSCVLSNIAQELKETSKKINVVDRLSRHLQEGVNPIAELNYRNEIIGMLSEDEPIVHIDDSDVTKPFGKHFEDLCIVRDGSASTTNKTVLKPGYRVAEATLLTKSDHPVSFFSKIYSTESLEYTSCKDVTFESIDDCVAYLGTATFVMDRGYDDNDVFNKLENDHQHYVIRLKMNRKVFVSETGKWTSLEELCQSEKRTARAAFRRRGQKKTADLIHIKGHLTANEKEISIIIVKGLADHPMVLATNLPINDGKDLIRVAGLYFTRWRIEEYFRCKKEMFDAENFRVRSLKSINALNFFLTVCMGFLAIYANTNSRLSAEMIAASDPVKAKVNFIYYRLASGIFHILKHTRSALKNHFRLIRPDQNQCHIPGFSF